MPTIRITPRWELDPQGVIGTAGELDTQSLLALLAAVKDTGAIAEAARSLGMSYRNAWGQIKKAEALFGHALVDAGRGRGSTLTALSETLIWADRRIAARLTPLLESLSSELQNEIERALPQPTKPLRLHASHGYAVAALMQRLNASGAAIELRYRNSFESVAALASGECDLAGFHVPLGAFQPAAVARYAQWLHPAEHQLVQLAVRTQGLMVAKANPKRILGVADLRRADVLFVNRPEGSGTRMLTELLLAAAGVRPSEVRGFATAEFTHAAVAAYVASGMADVGIGVQTAAVRFGLRFSSLTKERYFFAFRRGAAAMPALEQIFSVLGSASFRTELSSLQGYEAGQTGVRLEVGDLLDG